MPFSRLDDSASLWFEERGSGAPIVFLHGFPASSKVWRYQLDSSLAEHYKLIAPDLPGFGQSRLVGSPTTAYAAAAVRSLLDTLELGGVVLVGWSYGAGVVMKYCEDFGAYRLAGVGIVDDCPKLLPGDGWLADIHTPFSEEGFAEWDDLWGTDRAYLAERLSRSEFADPVRHEDNIAMLVEEAMKADDAMIDVLHDVARHDFRHSLSSLPVPALLLYGRHSNMTRSATATFMQTTCPQALLQMFDESGHNPMMEEPELFNQVLHDFVGSLNERTR